MDYVSIVSFLLGGMGAAIGILDLLQSPPCPKGARTPIPRLVPWVAAGSAGVGGLF